MKPLPYTKYKVIGSKIKSAGSLRYSKEKGSEIDRHFI